MDLLSTLSKHRKYFYFALLITNWVKSHIFQWLSSSYILLYLNITSSTSYFSHAQRSYRDHMENLLKMKNKKKLSGTLDTFELGYHILIYFHISFRNTILDDLQNVYFPLNDTVSFVNFIKTYKVLLYCTPQHKLSQVSYFLNIVIILHTIIS